MAEFIPSSGTLKCFKAYDIRGELGIDFDTHIAYRIGRAVGEHFGVGHVIIGRDARETSPELATMVARGVCDSGASVLDIGMAGTEEMYWAVTEFGAIAGVEVTASHNPINYNGLKIVKSGSRPLDDLADFQVIQRLAERAEWDEGIGTLTVEDISSEARVKYVKRVLSFISIDNIRPLRIVVNCGNGAAGPTFDAIAAALSRSGAQIDFICVHHQPDHSFPNGIPNPLLPENHAVTAEVVKKERADFGIAFDGDFDRCFFFDRIGRFIPGEYIVGLLASIFLDKEEGAKIVHDPRVVWNIKDTVYQKGGVAVQSKTGHAYIKKTMRMHKALYGGEISAHHYFRDFAYCDSGMIPWLLLTELISVSGLSLTDWVDDRFKKFSSSGEINFTVQDVDKTIRDIVAGYYSRAISIDETDGHSLAFEDWRFNLRKSNTEPLLRLNVEIKGHPKLLAGRLDALMQEISKSNK